MRNKLDRYGLTLRNKHVLITGIAGALGKKTAELLRGQGCTVIGIDKHNPKNDPNILVTDLSDKEAIAEVARKAMEKLEGRLDILINNAGVLHIQDVGDPPAKFVDEDIKVNLLAPWILTSNLMPHLRKVNGQVVNISSLFALVNAPFNPSYAITKRGITAFSDILRIQFGKEISVSTIYPGFMDTTIHHDAIRQGLVVSEIVAFRAFGTKIINFEEPVEKAARGVVKACVTAPRDSGATRLGTLVMLLGRIFPSFVDKFIQWRVSRLIKAGTLKINLDGLPSAKASFED